MTMKKSLLIIPARYQSSRFPGKPLAKIKGLTMIQRVYESVFGDQFDTVVVTDHKEIEQEVKNFGGEVVRIDDDVASGTERIWLAYKRFFMDRPYELIINVQGDEPLLKSKELERLIDFHKTNSYEICTMIKARTQDEEDFINPNIVKAQYIPSTGQCLTFSRSPIPYNRSQIKKAPWYQHIGVYSFTPLSLEQFSLFDVGTYEKLECLEQLRALENGFKIGAIETNLELIGIDTPDDIIKVEKRITHDFSN